jgi:hypothetical protein
MSDFRASELVLEGPLTIGNASVIRKNLISTLIREDEIVVSIDAEAPVDLSFLQLLCSAHRSASSLGKTFTLRNADSGNFTAAVENSGFTRKKGCIHDKSGTCLWVGGRHV